MKDSKETSFIKRMIERMRTDKKFEAGVYIALLSLIILFYLVLGGIEQKGVFVKETEQSSVLEVKLEQALAQMQGVGETHVMISYTPDGSGTIDGVLVIAQGAEDIITRGSIQSAVHTLLGVEPGKVGVYRMNEKTEVE